MTYRGKVKGGVIVLDGETHLPEGAEVRVEPVEGQGRSAEMPSLAERFKNVAGKAVGLPSDLAENHDHYLHGLPKRRP